MKKELGNMDMIIQTDNIEAYLESSEIIDFTHPDIGAVASDIAHGEPGEINRARRAYEYVRDQIRHSADINAVNVTYIASEVLKQGHGNCCAKAHLLAAILRRLKIPTGFCYQNWYQGNDAKRFLSIHGLNAIFIQGLGKWIRVDARGNKEGIHAEFDFGAEKLARVLNPTLGEADDPVIYAVPKEAVINAFRASRTRDELGRQWPKTPL